MTVSDGQRVLVVDDTDEIRTLIRRVLNTGGFQVETAATLAEARAMSPGGFEAVIVDANLGAERGTDLVKGLQEQDPAAAGRCLVISGGILGDMPEGVASLSKPFLPAQLLAAVRELTAHSPAPGSGAAAGPRTSATAPRDAPETASGDGWGWPVLALARDLRARERAGLAGYLHDGPVQELTAATLGLHLLRNQVPATQEQQLDELAERLAAAAAALRRVTDSGPVPGQAPTGPEAAIRERTAWLLGEPAIVAVPAGAALTPAEAEAVADVVELVLLPLTADGPRRARIEVGTAGGQLEIGTTVTPYPAGSPASSGQPTADPPAPGPTTGQPTTGQPTAGHPATGDPATGHPTTGDPATEDPATEDPATEDPAAEDPAAIDGQPGAAAAGILARALGGGAGSERAPGWCRVRLTVPRANLTAARPGHDAVT
jgi:CheY-like chemotaxis protein